MRDLRFAVRRLARRPGYTALIVGTLALGIGVNAVAFHAMDSVFSAPKRKAYAADIGWLFVREPGNPYGQVSKPTFEALRTSVTALENIAAEGRYPVAMNRADGSARAWAMLVSANYFSLVTVTPRLGRTLVPADATGAGLPVVVSERYWRTHLNRAPRLDNVTVHLHGQTGTVVGVLPEGFQGPGGVFEPDLWLPLRATRDLGLPADDAADSRWLTLFARPRAGTTPEAIRTEVEAVARSVRTAGAQSADSASAEYVPMTEPHPDIRGFASLAMFGVGAVLLVLLVACFNVAGLILARSAEQRRDFAVRATLGATRWRLTREMLTEHAVLATVAGLLAGVVTIWSGSALGIFAVVAPIPQQLHFEYSWNLVWFIAALVVLATVLPTIVPAARLRDADTSIALGGGRGSVGRVSAGSRRLFLRLQVAGSTLFLALALLVVHSFANALRFDPGFDPNRIAILDLSPAGYGYDANRAQALVRNIMARVGNDPRVGAVAVANRVPFYVGFTQSAPVSTQAAPCEPDVCPTAVTYDVTGGFFDAVGVSLVAGRAFDDGDLTDADAVVVNEAAADTFWPDSPAVGQVFREGANRRRRVVVGVVARFTQRAFGEPDRPILYRPITAGAFEGSLSLAVHTRGGTEAAALLPVLRSALRDLDPGLPPSAVQTMRDRMALPLWPHKSAAAFFGICGLMAMMFATVGLIGATYLTVLQRLREFGVRIALGATTTDINRQVVGEGIRQALPGMAIGLLAAVILAYLGRAAFVEISALDPITWAVAIGVQLGVVALAHWWPAQSATRRDPVRSLAAE